MDVEIGELGTLALADGLIISSPAVRTPLSSIRLYRDDRSSLPPLPFFVLLPLLLESMSASLIRRELRRPASGIENMPIDDPFDLPSFVIFCSPVRYRFWRDCRVPEASTVVVSISGEDGNDASGEGVLESAGSGSRGDHGGTVGASASFTLTVNSSSCSSSSDCRRVRLERSVSPRRKLDRRGDRTAGVPTELLYGDDSGVFGNDARLGYSPLVAGEDGVDRSGLPFRLLGRGGGRSPPGARSAWKVGDDTRDTKPSVWTGRHTHAYAESHKADTGLNANAPKGRSASPSNAAFNT